VPPPRSWPFLGDAQTGDRSPAGVGPNCPDIGRPADETVLLGESDKERQVMSNTEDVQRYADAIMAMIKEDQDTGQVPRNVCSWDELDDSVDAGDYYRLAGMPSVIGDAAALRDAVNKEVGQRLARAGRGRSGSLSG